MGLISVRLRRQQADPIGHPLDVAVNRHDRHPETEREHDRRGLLADAVDLGQPVARLERGQVAEERETVVAALLADVAERRLEPRRLLRAEAAWPDDVDQLRQRRELDGRPVGRRLGRRPSPPQPIPG